MQSPIYVYAMLCFELDVPSDSHLWTSTVDNQRPKKVAVCLFGLLRPGFGTNVHNFVQKRVRCIEFLMKLNGSYNN